MKCQLAPNSVWTKQLYRLLAICLIVGFSGTAFAEGAGPVVVDEGWAKDAGETRVQLLKVKKSGAWAAWSPQWHIFVRKKGAEKGDILALQHYKGKRKAGKPVKCRMKGAPSSYNDQVAYFLCGSDRATQFKKGGKFKTVLTYKSAEGIKFKDFRTLSYDVMQFKSSGGKKPQKGWAVNNDWRLDHGSVSTSRNNAHADIRVWVKFDRNAKPKPSMRCYYKGKKIESRSTVRAQLSPQYRFYRKNKDTTVVWKQFRFSMFKLVIGDESRASPDSHLTSKNPGEYKCVVVNDGDAIKEVHFAIKDGKVAAPKNCSAVPGARFTFVKVVTKGGDYKSEKNAYSKKAFWGLGGCKF